MVTPAVTPASRPFHDRLAAIEDAFREEAPRYLRYLYFLRFSILLWLFPLLLWWANWRGNARSLTSGILTPVTAGQYLCVAFFLIAASVVALVEARVVVINGEARFGEKPPDLLYRMLADEHFPRQWVALAISQTNVAILFLYFFANGRYEDVDLAGVARGLGLGAVLAALFWYVLTAIYYLTYRPGEGGRMTARTLLLPRRWLFLSADGNGSSGGEVLETADVPLRLQWLARLAPGRGYKWTDGVLYEGHYFSFLAAMGFAALYAMLWPLAAPVPVHAASWLALGFEVLGGLGVIAIVLSARLPRNPGPANEKALRMWKTGLIAAVMAFTAAIPWLYFHSDAARFPILALVLILVISLVWLLGGIAFFADRYRVPVLTAVLLALVVPRLFHWTGAREEHHFSIVMRGARPVLPTPGEILDGRIAHDRTDLAGAAVPAYSYIVVTSTGGGIHAAAWTAAVLGHLEQDFGGGFHDRVLLLSTVSGGSAGLYTYLRALHDPGHAVPADWQRRMVIESRCSSLEAVGWGLLYRDAPMALVPIFPSSSGIGDLNSSPLAKDRTWALRRAFERNLDDPFCEEGKLVVAASQSTAERKEAPIESQELSLTSFPAVSTGNGAPVFPAFAMNTTTVEGGSRFLLANYWIKPHTGEPLVPQPAESFLSVYGRQSLLPGHPGYADLPLATAAQLSATFPYVSSAATFPEVPGKESAHFVDGGYYDNDGTASAIEFLREALDGSNAMKAGPPSGAEGNRNGNPAPGARPKLRILLVEIRNSLDPSHPNRPQPSPPASALRNDPDCKPWNLLDQLAAPPKAFYGAGHGSVTERNRNALALLERAYAGQLVLEHFVIDDETNGADTVTCRPAKNPPPTDPLNWSLTPKQQSEVDRSAELYADKYAQVHACFAEGRQCPQGNAEATAP